MAGDRRQEPLGDVAVQQAVAVLGSNTVGCQTSSSIPMPTNQRNSRL